MLYSQVVNIGDRIMAAREEAGKLPDRSLPRRDFLKAATLTAAVAHPAVLLAEETRPTYRVAVIGHTGRGNYGHNMDTVWLSVPEARVVAVADGDETGLAAAVKRLGQPQGFRDYREMLEKVKPELVTICPRWLDQHRDMVVAACEHGVRGIYMEKPMCRTLAEADEMVAACEKHKVKLVIAHQTRYSPKLPVVRELIASGALGQVLEFRARGKEDARGGGEDLWVLGTHLFNLIHHLGGKPLWCFGSVEQDGRAIRREDVTQGPEGIGPLAGDQVHAMYRLEGGATAYFDSVRKAGGRPSRFGLQIFGTQGIVDLYDTGMLPTMHFLADSSWTAHRTDKKAAPISSAGVGKEEPLANGGLPGGNILAVRDLIESVEKDRLPASSIYEARTATEMIVAVFESQRLGKPVSLPLVERRNPLSLL